MPHPKRLLETLEAFQIRRYKNGPRKTTKTKSIPKWTSKGNATDQSFPFLTSKIRNDSPNGSHSCLTSILHGAHNIPSMNSDCSPVSIIKAIQWSTRSQRLKIQYILAHARQEHCGVQSVIAVDLKLELFDSSRE